MISRSLAGAVLAALALLLSAGCSSDSSGSPTGDREGSAAATATAATLSTSLGDIEITLYPDKAPKTVANFVGLATGEKEYTDPRTQKKSTAPYYDGTVFHRVIAGFMIQGGDPTRTGTGGPGYEFANESSDLSFDRPYRVAMANAGPDTNGAQFFITVAETPHLDGGYTIFGQVEDPASQKVVDAIATAPVNGETPVEPVAIRSVAISD